MSKIKLLVLDVDGVLTDGLYHVCSDGHITKSFQTRDFAAIERLSYSGVKVLIMTQSTGECIIRKKQQLRDTWRGHFDLATNVASKAKALGEYLVAHGILWDDVSYIGDSFNDMDCLRKAGVPACPSDAMEKVQKLVEQNGDGIVCINKGGQRCVEELIAIFEPNGAA